MIFLTGIWSALADVQDPLIFAPASPQIYGAGNQLSVSGGSGSGAVSYTVVSGPGEIIDTDKLVLTAGTGTVVVRASKDGDGTYDPTSVDATVEASPAETVLTLDSSINPALYPQSVTFSATVANALGLPPTGMVIFSEGETVLNVATLDDFGQAAITLDALSVGTHVLNAVYTGDANFATSSTQLSQAVVQDTTAPVIVAPNITVMVPAGQCDAVVNFTPEVRDDFDLAPVLICDPPSGSTFNVGRTTVTCLAIDASGNSVTKTFTVSIYPAGMARVGATWTAVDSARDWKAIAASADGTKLVAVEQNGSIYTSTDSGNNWTPRMTDQSRAWQSVTSSADGVRLAAVVMGGQIYTSSDSGETWTAQMTDMDRSWAAIASSADGSKLAAIEQYGSVYTSADFGANWTAHLDPMSLGSVASSADGSTLVVGTVFDQVYISTDSGMTWTPKAGSRVWSTVASSADGTRLVAADFFGDFFGGGQIYTSSDSGATWTGHGPTGFWTSVASSADGSHLVAVESGGQIFNSTDYGVNWTANETARSWSAAACSADGNKLFAAEAGGQLYVSIDNVFAAPTIVNAVDLAATAAFDASGAGVLFNVYATNTCLPVVNVVCTPESGTVFPVGVTTVTCVATDDLGNTSSASFKVTVNQESVTTVTSSQNPTIYGQSVTIKATVSDSPIAPTGSVTFSEGGVVRGTVPVDDSRSATLTIGTFTGGAHTIDAAYSGDTFHLASAGTYVQQVDRASQAPLSFAPASPQLYGATNLLVAGGGSGSGAMVYSVESGPGTIVEGDKLVATAGTGVITVKATRLGDGNFNPAELVAQVIAAPVTVRVEGVAGISKVYDGKIAASLDFWGATLVGTFSGDTVHLDSTAASGRFGDSNVGTDKEVIITGVALAGADASSYTLVQPGATASITPAALTGTVSDQTRVYGETNPVFEVHYSGFVNGEGADLMQGPLGFTCVDTNGLGVGTNTPVGTYPIHVAVAQTAPNYTVHYVDGVLAINQALLTVTANDQGRVYGHENPEFAGTLIGVMNHDAITASFETSATIASPAGPYAITPVLSDPDGKLKNYIVITNSGILTVSKALLTITADNKTRQYGAGDPPFTITYAGFVNGDGPGSLAALPVASTGATAASRTGTHPISVGGAASPSYEFAYEPGTLTISKAPLTVAVSSATRRYGQVNPAFGATVTGLLNGDTISAVLSTAATAASPVGSYAIDLSWNDPGSRLSEYDLTVNGGSLSVTPALLTGQTLDMSRGYGQTNPQFAVSYSGFVNGETTSVLTGSLGFLCLDTNSTSVGTNTPIGSYPIHVAVGQNAPNYTIGYLDGTLTVTQAILTVTARDATRSYGSPDPEFAALFTGFVNGEDTNALGGALTLTTSATVSSPVGSYPIVPAGLTSSNYSIVFVDGSLIISPALLTGVVQNATRVYGEPNPEFSVKYSGFANGEGESVLTGALTIGCTDGLGAAVVGNTAVGSYPIHVSKEQTSPNYTIQYVDGVLAVTPAPLTVTAANVSRLYGTANPAFTALISGFVNNETSSVLRGGLAFNTLATQSSPVGTYAITPGGYTSANYAIHYVDGTLSINRASLTGRVASQERAYGQTNAPFAVSYSGFVNGDQPAGLSGAVTYHCADLLGVKVDTNTTVGVYAIQAAGQTSPNYNITYLDGSISITQAVLMVTADKKARAYGQANPVLTASFAGFVNNEDTNFLSGAAALSTTATESSPVGDYEITAALGTLSATNYSFVFSNGTMSVGTVVLTVTAENRSRTYGAANPALTYTVTGFANGDTASILTGQPDLITTATGNSGAGSYPINISKGTLSASNYVLQFVGGTLEVTKAPLIITADGKTRGYGAANPQLTLTYSGFVNGEGAASLSLAPVVATAATLSSPVGTYPISVTGAQSSNYQITEVAGTLAVTQAVLTVTANNATRTYGAANPPFTAAFSGFVNGENANVLSGTLAFATTANASSPVATYPIVPSGLTSPNYAIVFADGSLTVTPASLTGTVQNATRIYGQPNPAFTVQYTGFVNGENSSVVTGPLTFACVDGLGHAVATNTATGSYPIHVSQGQTSPNYTIHYVDGVLGVTPAPLTVTAANASRLYGESNPTFTAGITGFVNNETSNVLGGSLAFTTLATQSSPVGTYAITPGGLTSANYAIHYADGTLSVTPASLTGRVNSQERAYGQTNAPFAVSYSGFVNGDQSTGLSGSLTYHCVDSLGEKVDTNTTVGVYAIQATGQSSPNYTVAYVDGTLSITQAVLTVTADKKARAYGLSNPVLTASFTGFVNNEDTNVINGAAALSTTATENSPVGDYEITVALGSLSATNYSFVLSNGTLSVGTTVLTVTAQNKSRTYGAANPALTYTVSGFANGDTASILTGQPDVSTTANVNSGAGTYPISISKGTLSASNYVLQFVGGTLDVTKAPLTITAEDKSRGYGAANPQLTLAYSGFVNGEGAASLSQAPVVATEASLTSPVGTYPITVTGAQSSNYQITEVSGTLAVTQAVLTVTANKATRTYGVANPTFAAAFSGFVNGENANVLGGTLAFATTASASSPVGTYSIVPSGLSSPNYAIVFANGSLTVTPALLTGTVQNATRIYGQPNPAFSVQYTGFANGENFSVVSGPLTFTCADGLGNAVVTNTATGSYPIHVSHGQTSANYTIQYIDGALTITPAPLTVTAANASRLYGSANPTFTAAINGFVNNETSSVLGGSLAFGTLAAQFSQVGTYGITPGGFTSANYAIHYVDGTLSVTPASLTGRVASQERTYGQTNAPFAVSYSGFVNGDQIASLSGALTYHCVDTLGVKVDTNTTVGVYAIQATGQSSPNYAITYVDGTLSITQAVLTVRADNKARAYGQPNPLLTASFAGFLNNEDTNVLRGVAQLSTTATESSPVGDYEIAAALGSLSATNYSFVFNNGTLSVGKTMLTVTAENKSRAYGAANPTLTYTVSGFINGDTASVLSGQPDVSTSANPNSGVGAYPITLSAGTLSASNYVLQFAGGTMTVTKAPLTISAENKTRSYGAQNPELTLAYSGLVNGEGASSLTPAPVVATDADIASPVGVYAITVTGAQSPNYEITQVAGTLNVTKAPLSITAANASRVYGQPNPNFTGTVTGLMNNDSIAVDCSAATTLSSPVGAYVIVPRVVDPNNKTGNYDVTVQNGTLSVTPAALIGRVAGFERAYGQLNPAFDVSYTGFVNGDDRSALSGTLEFACVDKDKNPVGTNTMVGSYPVRVVTGQNSPNYTVSYLDGSLVITQALLTVKADNKDRVYGAANPALTWTVTGFVNGEESSVLSGNPDVNTEATLSSPIGKYDIVLGVGTLSATNYGFVLSNGTLTIGKALLTVTAENKSRVYGSPNPELTYTVAGFVDGENASVLSGKPSLTTSALVSSPAGSYAINAGTGDLSATNYAFAFVNGSLAVTKAPLTVAADDQTRVYGSPNQPLSIRYSGFVNSEGSDTLDEVPTVTTSADSLSPVGSYDISLSGGKSGNYDLHLVKGTLTVTKASLTATADNQSRRYGQSNPTFTITYSGFVNGDNASSLGTAPAASTDADANSPVGTYAITLSGGSAQNYEISRANGVLTVTKGTIVATAENQSRVYGQANPALSVRYSGFVNNENVSVLDSPPTAITTATATSPVGTYMIALEGGHDGNYDFQFVSGTLTVTKAAMTITANNATRTFGATNPVFTGTIVGLVNGGEISATYSTPAEINSPAGTYPIVPAIVDPQGLANNYTVTLNNGTLTVTAGLVLTAEHGSYVIGNQATNIDSNALVAEGGGMNYGGGTLAITIVTNADQEDIIAIEPMSGSKVAVNGGKLSFNGVEFGTFTGGSGTTPLIVSLNANATSAALTDLLRYLTFATPATNTNVRAIEVVLTYGNTTLSGIRVLDLNRPPVAMDDVLVALAGTSINIPFSAVLTNDVDADGDALSIADFSIASSKGGRITVTGNRFTYRPPTGDLKTDSFAYMVQDGRGGQCVAFVTLKFVQQNQLTIELGDQNIPEITMGGTAGRDYRVDASDDLANWTPLGIVTANSMGAIQVVDLEAKGTTHRFYRAVAQ